MSAVWNAVLGTLFTWGVTAAGAALVFVFPTGAQHAKLQQQLLDGSLGFAGGVMLAASYFSLLAPAVEMAAGSPTYGETWAFIPATVGFLMGAAFVYAGDKYGPVDALSSYMALDDSGMRKKMDLSGAAAEENELHTPGKHGPRDFDKEWQLRRRKPDLESDYDDSFHKRVVSKAERRLQLHRVFLLVFAVTIHNFPEGLAVGVGFGGVGSSPKATLQSAWALAIGIGLQNFPEGFAVSVPLHRAGMSKLRSFFYGQLSGMVEPIAGLIGAIAVNVMAAVLPYSLGFAAGAMVYVVVDDIVPEAHSSHNATLASWGVILGFAVMMAMDVATG